MAPTARPSENMVLSRAFVLRVGQLRIQRGWSSTDLAKRVTDAGYAMGKSTINNQETRLSGSISIDQAVATANAFGVPLSVLLEEPRCSACSDAPPAGFTCRGCGTEG